jgi:hypothetical protein
MSERNGIPVACEFYCNEMPHGGIWIGEHYENHRCQANTRYGVRCLHQADSNFLCFIHLRKGQA